MICLISDISVGNFDSDCESIHNLQYLLSTRILENPQQIKIQVKKFIKSIKCKKFIKTKKFILLSIFLITNYF